MNLQKYVRVGNNFYFGHMERDHSSLVPSGQKAVSAGLIILDKTTFTHWKYGSETCNLTPAMCLYDIEEIASWLKMPHLPKQNLN